TTLTRAKASAARNALRVRYSIARSFRAMSHAAARVPGGRYAAARPDGVPSCGACGADWPMRCPVDAEAGVSSVDGIGQLPVEVTVGVHVDCLTRVVPHEAPGAKDGGVGGQRESLRKVVRDEQQRG